jgi:hypothetical protein
MLVMAYNVVRTISQAGPAGRERRKSHGVGGRSGMNFDVVEKNIGLMLVGIIAVISLGGLGGDRAALLRGRGGEADRRAPVR